jgi:hypothetical protein
VFEAIRTCSYTKEGDLTIRCHRVRPLATRLNAIPVITFRIVPKGFDGREDSAGARYVLWQIDRPGRAGAVGETEQALRTIREGTVARNQAEAFATFAARARGHSGSVSE